MLRGILLLLFLFSVFCLQVYAEEIPAAEEWDPVSIGPATTWIAATCGKGELLLQPFFFYHRIRGTFNAKGHYDSLSPGDKQSQYQELLFMQYGLTERLEVAGQLAYQQNFIKQAGLKAYSRGFADTYIFLRYCLLEEEKILPHLTGLFQLKIPSGKYQKADAAKLETDLMGDGSYDHGYGIILTKRVKPFVMHVDLIYSFPLERKIDGSPTQYAGYLNYDFGFEYFLPQGFNLLLELNGFLQGDQKENGAKIPASDSSSLAIASGIGWSRDKIQALLAYQRALVGTNTEANDSVVLTLAYTF